MSSERGRKQIDEYLENGIASYREAMDCLMGIMVEYEMALHPITGLYVRPPEHSSLPKQIAHEWIERWGWPKIVQIDSALTVCYNIIRENGVHPESFVCLFGSRLFAKICIVNYGTNHEEVNRINKNAVSVPHRLLVPYDEDTDLQEMVMRLAVEDAHRTVQGFGMCGVSGFELDGRGFLVLDAQKVPDEMEGFIDFLSENVEEMQGVEAVWHSDSGKTKEEVIDIGIQAIMDEDEGNWSHRNESIDPDSDDNDDEVVRW